MNDRQTKKPAFDKKAGFFYDLFRDLFYGKTGCADSLAEDGPR
jgi:hypothetical protein